MHKHPQIRRPDLRSFGIERTVSGCRYCEPPSETPRTSAGDSVWVVVRATIPHRSIRRGECFKAISILQASEGIMELGELSLDSGHFMPDEEGDVDVTTRPGRMQNLYLSWRFAWDERMRMNTFIVVFASLTDGRHLFQYLPLMLPLFWIDDTEDEFYWPRSAEIPEEALLDHSPFETAVE